MADQKETTAITLFRNHKTRTVHVLDVDVTFCGMSVRTLDLVGEGAESVQLCKRCVRILQKDADTVCSLAEIREMLLKSVAPVGDILEPTEEVGPRALILELVFQDTEVSTFKVVKQDRQRFFSIRFDNGSVSSELRPAAKVLITARGTTDVHVNLYLKPSDNLETLDSQTFSVSNAHLEQLRALVSEYNEYRAKESTNSTCPDYGPTDPGDAEMYECRTRLQAAIDRKQKERDGITDRLKSLGKRRDYVANCINRLLTSLKALEDL